ncbi:hypothetical protein [Paenibacillus montanisoli]|uniref:Uncharacterized protein n=1 Tax=Paenibacillus montanisoli TaxID=2081970 RepID=A0A328TUL7_9BACL|nr:hypothetical protein [Paenibacillus montanisoli]RAP74207.1 hypothetical protein DL346_24415 [Paenibacillus montanisoli]
MVASTTPNELLSIIENTISMEVRIADADVKNVIQTMEGYGFKSKNSWASVQLPGHTVVEFWKKEFLKG